jgi:hypothetical protein
VLVAVNLKHSQRFIFEFSGDKIQNQMIMGTPVFNFETRKIIFRAPKQYCIISYALAQLCRSVTVSTLSLKFKYVCVVEG